MFGGRHKQTPSFFARILTALDRRAGLQVGKAVLPVFLVLFVSVFIGAATGFLFEASVPQARANDVTTSLTVLNTPPSWTVEAHEAVASATSTPTDAGATLSFIATGTDSSNDNYWLLICSASSTPTANVNAAPTCGSGIQWAVSGSTVSGTQATAATTTTGAYPFNNESNAWYGYICDGNSTGPQCNKIMENGNYGYTGTNQNSPFVINHPPSFSIVTSNSPQDPGGTLTWTATAFDSDTIRGGDTVQLTVCKSNDFSTTTDACGAGGTWAQSTFVASNPATSTPIVIPTQDNTYSAYVYVVDQNFLAATTTLEGSASPYVVNNVAPSIDPTSITLTDPASATTTYITLTNLKSTSGPYYVDFSVVDNNGCQNASSGNEITLATTTIYRSGVGLSACQVSSDFNTNSCYPSSNPETNITCVQDTSGALTGDACTGPTDSSVGWRCTFNLWYNADPTVAGSQYASQNWVATVQAEDDNGADSTATTSTTGSNEVDMFLGFDVGTTSISYGGLQPGQSNDPLSATTSMIAEGNVGLDESLYGDTMCTTWTGPDSCDVGGPDPTKKITVDNQHFATSSVAYATGTSLTGSTSPTSVALHVPKTTATSSPQSKDTWWGILVPATITVAGSYKGQNTITVAASNPTYW